MTPLPTVASPVAGTVAGALDLIALAQDAAALARGSRSDATWRAYRSDWAAFERWCAGSDLKAVPATPVTVGLYLTDSAATLSIATLTRRLSAIAVHHRLAGHHLDTRHPAIRDVMAGLRRAKGTASRQAEALTVPLAQRAVATCGTRLIDLRDRALLVVGLAGGFRRSELVALTLADVTVTLEGLRVLIRRSKGDQDGAGQVIGISRTGRATCPVTAYETWIAAAGIIEGTVFRSVTRHGNPGARLSDRAVALIVKRRAGLAGLTPEHFSGHSLRAGFATSAARAGIPEPEIMRVTRHRSVAVLRRYVREGELFIRNVTGEIGL